MPTQITFGEGDLRPKLEGLQSLGTLTEGEVGDKFVWGETSVNTRFPRARLVFLLFWRFTESREELENAETTLA